MSASASSNGKNKGIIASTAPSTSKTRREHINALVQLANAGARRQQRFAVLDLAILLVPIVALIWFVPLLGWILFGLFAVVAVLFTLLLQTAGARSRKVLDDPRDVTKVVIGRHGRHGMARAWMVVKPNRLVVLAILDFDVDVFLSALKTVAPHVGTELFDTANEARNVANKLLKSAGA